ncbi:cell cycle checkpoint [Tilletiaria anomala UBC 951]|uniref:Checkpoint protein n=1 Tax=Tilletiaria anomala (strain ATCC 24038 / CBS 436.72 / UBC 951) TaxID=1037660 RepID=A0A066WPQ1_TILAU|nr:cell cycle checkpoint [Tilletiaria anomala UBC 951]KDN52969.1 cell cycle checkpoint [Tilletiaria anomala UBC 951]
MRFRTGIEAISTLLKVFQSVNKISTHCILNLSPDEVRIICTGESDGVQIWTTLTKDQFFKDYRVESKYKNIINLEISTEMLISVLKSAQDTSDVTMRLAKRGSDPLLSFAIVSMSHTGAKMEIEHEVLIKLIKPPDWEQIREPHCPEPDVHIVLPRLLKMRTVAERMSRMSFQITFSANLEGALTLGITSDEVNVETTWRGLSHPEFRTDENDGDAKGAPQRGKQQGEFRSVTLEMRSFLRFLSSYNVETSTIACICVDHCAIFYVYIGDQQHPGGVMTFFIPGLISDT